MQSLILAAEARIRSFVRETPTERCHWLSAATGCDVYLKLENFQRTCSFKLRGALNKVLCEADNQPAGFVAASAGNHGAGLAYALSLQQVPGTVFVPASVSATQAERIQAYGVKVVHHGDDCLETERAAREHAEQRGLVYVSPYNDVEVMAGQGTIGVELERQLAPFDAVFAALGGGGLVGGIGSYLKAALPNVEVVACSPENSPVMHRSLEAGRIVELDTQPTLSSSTAGGIEPDSITFEACRKTIDRRVLVAEDEIREMMGQFLDRQQMLVEGAAAMAAAGLVREARHFAGQKVVVVICGANVSRAQLREVLGDAPPT